MKTKSIVIALASALAFALVAQQRNTEVPRPPGSADPAATITSKLSEIVSIRERLAKDYDLMIGAGRAPFDGLAEIELAEARIELARERAQPDAIITELKGLIAAHERRLKRIQAVAIDRLPTADIDRARTALLGAEVRLLREQK